MFYSTKIFSTTGFDANTGTALVGIVNLLSTLCSTFLLIKYGRKSLLWVFSFANTAVLVGLGMLYRYGNPDDVGIVEIVLVLLFVAFFEFSIGPITWIYMSEVMTEKGVSIGTLFNWIFCLIMALITPTLIDAITGWLFVIFGILCCICGFFVIFFLKETKGLTNA